MVNEDSDVVVWQIKRGQKRKVLHGITEDNKMWCWPLRTTLKDHSAIAVDLCDDEGEFEESVCHYFDVCLESFMRAIEWVTGSVCGVENRGSISCRLCVFSVCSFSLSSYVVSNSVTVCFSNSAVYFFLLQACFANEHMCLRK